MATVADDMIPASAIQLPGCIFLTPSNLQESLAMAKARAKRSIEIWVSKMLRYKIHTPTFASHFNSIFSLRSKCLAV
jgi:hypothetical protein